MNSVNIGNMEDVDWVQLRHDKFPFLKNSVGRVISINGEVLSGEAKWTFDVCFHSDLNALGALTTNATICPAFCKKEQLLKLNCNFEEVEILNCPI